MAYEFRAQCANKILGAFSIFRIPTFDPVSFAVMGFGIVLAAALPFVF
jgi:hypothetical protein